LLVYDVTNRASFEHAEDWLKDVRDHADPNLTCILVANKVDLVGEEGGLGGNSANASARASLDVPGGEEAVRRRSGEGFGTIGKRSKKRREVGREEAELWAREHGVSGGRHVVSVADKEFLLFRCPVY
jgi:Ras-related protein Rab-2A